MDTDTLLSRFEAEYLEVNSISPDRRGEQLRVLRRFEAGLDHPLIELTRQDFTTFLGAELKRGVSPNTTRKYRIMIRSFITWASEADLIDTDRTLQLQSVPNPRGSTSHGKPNPYKQSEVAEMRRRLAEVYPALPAYGRGSRLLTRFVQGKSPAMRRHLLRHARRVQLEAQIALAIEEGLRSIEIMTLTIPALHYDNTDVVVRTAKKGPGVPQMRAVPYFPHARECMREWLDLRWLLRPDHDSPWLALTRDGLRDQQLAPLSVRSFRESLGILGPWRWHRLRHTAITGWAAAGIPLVQMQIAAGHARIEQTMEYVKLANSDVSSAFGAASEEFARRMGLAA
jgi:site-specific recombinase XerD